MRSLGHAVFAVTMIGLGIAGLVHGTFTPTWSGVPRSMPAREVFSYLCAIVSLASGIGLLFRRTAVVASRVLLGYLVAWLLLVRVTRIFFAPTALDTWWAIGDTSVMLSAAWVLYVWFAADRGGERFAFVTGDRGLRIARVFYGLALIPFGVAHFTNLNDTAPLIPAWVPWHVFWAYFTGGAFLAAGIAILIGVYARLAATLSAVQIGLFTVIVWVPFVVAGPSAFQWSEFLDSWALTAGAWVVADSFRGTPWLAPRMRSAALTQDFHV
jgi:uncharacterized membrane protein